ncbi:MAG: class I SAM-dependent methyltransferase [Tetrasphaera sp.]
MYEAGTKMAFVGRRRAVYSSLARRAQVRAGETVIDIGSGTGALTSALAAYAGPSGHVLGIDPSRDMIAFARRLAPANVTYAVASADSLPAPDGSVDVVASALAVHHIPPEERTSAMTEINRVLRPGGRMLLADFQPPRGRLARWVTRVVTGSRMADNDPANELVQLCEAAGLTVAERGRQGAFFVWVRGAKDRPTPEETR